ncbi:MAG: rhodanese-like domain-containing protein [Pseudomonadota bacterium]|nr:rhodanese-like domain-containing protein [Pseudomonadota bacterium]
MPLPRAPLFIRTRRQTLRALAVWLPALPVLAQAPHASTAVSLEQARALHEKGEATLIDVREPHEHARGVVAGAHLLPLSQLKTRAGEIPRDASRPVLIICATQNRSGRLVAALREQGWTHVYNVHGGMTEWARRGWPMVKPASP